MTIEEAIRKLAAAAITLYGTTDRPIARRNARRRVLKELRVVRAALDETWPAIKKVSSRKYRTGHDRIKFLRRTGWADVHGDETIKRYLLAGVRVVKVTINHSQQPNAQLIRDYYFVREWAKAIGPDKPAQLRAAKKSRQLQDAAVAADLLKQSA